jgi:nucleotide-binding universal stress UspA family protein
LPVFETVVWATDGSEAAGRALPYARGLLRADSTLVVVHVREQLVGRTGGQPEYAHDESVERGIRHQVEWLRDDGVDVKLHLVTSLEGNAARAVAETATELGADVIVLGTRGQSPLAGAILGSVTQRLLHLARCAVLAVPPLVSER